MSESLCQLGEHVFRNLILPLGWMLGLIDYAFLLVTFSKSAKFFSQGYGDVDQYQSKLEASLTKVRNNRGKQPLLSDKDIDWGKVTRKSDVTVQEARFLSPAADELPAEAAYSKFYLVRPSDFDETRQDEESTYIVSLPATGEMGIGTRLRMARQLARDRKCCTLILTAPFYADRKPQGQTGFFLRTVEDILVQGKAIIFEAAALSAYITNKSPKTKVCFTGFSFGAAMAGCSANCAIMSGVDGKRLAVCAYVGSGSPCVLADGILANSIQWEALVKNDNSKTTEQGKRRQTLQELFDELSKTQLDFHKAPKNNRLALCKGYSMTHDAFIKPRYALEYERAIQENLTESYQVQWFPGGHVFAAVARTYLHTKLLVETIEEFEKM